MPVDYTGILEQTTSNGYRLKKTQVLLPLARLRCSKAEKAKTALDGAHPLLWHDEDVARMRISVEQPLLQGAMSCE